MFCSLGYLGKRISIIYNISKLELLFQQQKYILFRFLVLSEMLSFYYGKKIFCLLFREKTIVFL